MNRWLFMVLVLITTSLMGSSFAIGKVGLAYVSPLLLVGLRFTLAGVLMAMFVTRRKNPTNLRDWSKVALIGLFQTAGVMGCIFISLRTITASESSILTFTNPLLVIIFGTLFMKVRYRFVQWIGVLTGFFGVFITLGFHVHLRFGTWLGILGAVSWALATLLIKRWGVGLDTWVLTAYQMLFGGLLLLIGSFTVERAHIVLNGTSVFVIVWLAIMASIVQFAIWFYLLHHGDPGKTSAFLFLAPFFGVLSGWLILGEVVRWPVMIGGLLIFVGIFLVNWPEPKLKVRKELRDV
ncbi:DMT family transporter [Alicyclobacillus sp. SO9]|uniref:DMT family transporter n=1 Tax=Alicyclobacillus sp. SO9 TaxID=2665646 RepID=UPI0018E84F69|nr:DMT family transporter [Alicyclobacillus sp. SO9]QQE80410.1 DMT family transporter [Alicyclobacillus sp. SO9]